MSAQLGVNEQKSMLSTTALLTVKALDPARSAAYSPNLYGWLRARGAGRREGLILDDLYRVRSDTPLARTIGAGTLIIGHPYDGFDGDADLSGIRLIEVLVNGSSSGRMCLVGAVCSVELVADFWTRYQQVGRCAFDPLHMEHFVGAERYVVTGGAKKCLWCGADCSVTQ